MRCILYMSTTCPKVNCPTVLLPNKCSVLFILERMRLRKNVWVSLYFFIFLHINWNVSMFGGCYLLPIGCWPPQIVSHWSPTHSNEAIIKVIYLIQIVCNDKYFSALHVIMFGRHILFSLVVGSHKLSVIGLQYIQ